VIKNDDNSILGWRKTPKNRYEPPYAWWNNFHVKCL